MSGLNDEEILSIWQAATDYLEGWWYYIGELNSFLDVLREQLPEELEDRIEYYQKRIAQIEGEIAELVEMARQGEISPEDLENAFREKYEELSEVDQELLELEEESFVEEEDSYWEEDEEF